MDVREKLVELLKTQFYDEYEFEEIADWLIAHGVTVQEWIPVTERLPDVGIEVLIYSEDDGVCVDYYGGDSFGYYDATHWMPLSEPPKGE